MIKSRSFIFIPHVWTKQNNHCHKFHLIWVEPYFINRRFSPATGVISKRCSFRNRSIETRNFQVRVRWGWPVSLQTTVNKLTLTMRVATSNIVQAAYKSTRLPDFKRPWAESKQLPHLHVDKPRRGSTLGHPQRLLQLLRQVTWLHFSKFNLMSSSSPSQAH